MQNHQVSRSIKIGQTRFATFSSIKAAASIISRVKTIAISVNAEVLINNDPDLIKLINHHLGYPDGIGAVLAAKAAGLGRIPKIAGVELWTEVLGITTNKSLFLVGAKQEVLDKVIIRINSEHPSIHIAGAINGYFQKSEEAIIVRSVVNKHPDIVVIAMGQPYQEKLAARIFTEHKCLILCVGGSFDVYAGLKKRAPKLLIDLGLEWLYRLLQEPSRFARYTKLVRLVPLLLRLYAAHRFMRKQ